MTLRQRFNRPWPAIGQIERAAAPLRGRSLRALALFSLVALDFGYGFRLARVNGHSMEPTFRPGQWLLVRRLNWPSPTLQVGEVIVFQKEGEWLVKRVAALPGRRPPEDNQIALWRARLAAEGRVLRLSGPLAVSERPVPRGHLWVLGDNAAVSDDSRAFGPIPHTSVIGRVLRWSE
jgi:signal peptidase I